MGVVEVINNGLELLSNMKQNQVCVLQIKTDEDTEPKPILIFTREFETPSVWIVDNTGEVFTTNKDMLKCIASAFIEQYIPGCEFTYVLTEPIS
jgi:hypothetical protein